MDFRNKTTVRKATKEDIPLIRQFIQYLAEYEKRPEDMTATEKQLEHWLFERNIATVLFLEYDHQEIGYALYYPVFGSFAAVGKVHLEDLYINQRYRGLGLGRTFLSKIVEKVLEEGYTKMEWSCLNWNNPSIAFYDSMGAKKETGRKYFEFDKGLMERLAALPFDI